MRSIVNYYNEEINYGVNYRAIPLQKKNKKINKKIQEHVKCSKLKRAAYNYKS